MQISVCPSLSKAIKYKQTQIIFDKLPLFSILPCFKSVCYSKYLSTLELNKPSFTMNYIYHKLTLPKHRVS